MLLAVTVAMAFQNFAAPNPKQEQVDSQIILLASNGAVIFFTGAQEWAGVNGWVGWEDGLMHGWVL